MPRRPNLRRGSSSSTSSTAKGVITVPQTTWAVARTRHNCALDAHLLYSPMPFNLGAGAGASAAIVEPVAGGRRQNCACRALERAFASAVGRAAAIAEERRSGAGPAMAAPLQCKPSVCGLGRLSARLPLSQGLLVRVVALYWSPSPRPFAPWKVIAFSAARERPGVAVSAVLRPAHACGQCLSGARSVGSF